MQYSFLLWCRAVIIDRLEHSKAPTGKWERIFKAPSEVASHCRFRRQLHVHRQRVAEATPCDWTAVVYEHRRGRSRSG